MQKEYGDKNVVITADEGMWITESGEREDRGFYQQVATPIEREFSWQEVTDEYKTQWEAEHPEPNDDEPTE